MLREFVMFGLLKPSLADVSAENKSLYYSSYCNLCASLSATGKGAINRFFLVNDVATVNWLLSEKTAEEYEFSCANCVKTGVIGKKKRVSSHQKFLAAVSSFVCGVKIQDKAIDEPKLKYKAIEKLYRPIMKKAENTLREHEVLETLQQCMSMNQENEQRQLSILSEASAPTEKCYEVITLEIAKNSSSLPEKIIRLLGQYMGRCVYLIDAIKDMAEDQQKKQYNVLNLMIKTQKLTRKKATAHCLNFIKPMHVEIINALSSLPQNASTALTCEKLNSLLISIKRQLFTLIKPLNDKRLLGILSSFSTLTDCFSASQSAIHYKGKYLVGGGGGGGGGGSSPCCGCCKSAMGGCMELILGVMNRVFPPAGYCCEKCCGDGD